MSRSRITVQGFAERMAVKKIFTNQNEIVSFEENRMMFELNLRANNATISAGKLSIAGDTSTDNGYVWKGNMINNRLRSIFLDESTIDVAFMFKHDSNGRVPAHKLILASCSSVFETMFFGSLPEQGVIHMTDVTRDVFTEFIRYIYYDEVKLSMESVTEMMYLAKKYEMNELMDICESYVMRALPIDQTHFGLELASKFDLLKLETFWMFQISRYTQQYIDSKGFVNCIIEILQRILQWDDLKHHGREMLKLCIRWAQNAWNRKYEAESEPTMADLRTMLKDCPNILDFGAMTNRTIVSILAEHSNFFTPSELVMVQEILVARYPVDLKYHMTLTCELQIVDTPDPMYLIGEIGTVQFQLSKKLFFVGYRHAPIESDDLNAEPLYIEMKLTKKSTNGNQSDDIVLLRQKHIANHTEAVNSIESETLALEPHTKYEIRLTFPDDAPGKFYFTTFYDPNDYFGDFEDEVTIGTAPGYSIISSLEFTH